MLWKKYAGFQFRSILTPKCTFTVLRSDWEVVKIFQTFFTAYEKQYTQRKQQPFQKQNENYIISYVTCTNFKCLLISS